MSTSSNTSKKTEAPPAPTSSANSDTLLLNVVQRYFKLAAQTIFVWAFGYFEFSPSWLLLGLVVYVWKERNTKAKKKQVSIAQAIARGEKGVILSQVQDLPSWVFFPDVERAEWLNKMIDQMWPYIGDYTRRLLVESIEPKIQQSAGMMASFKFTKIDLGDIPPRIGGVKVYTENVRRDEIYMDFELIHSSDCNIEVRLKGVAAGIKDLMIHGTMRVIFKPLISKMPLIGGLNVFFLNNPSIDFNLTSLANALDLPGLNDMLYTIVHEQIANIMVLPNRISVALANRVDLTRLRYPLPQGVIRIQVIEAKDLVKADIGVMGKGKSDPYAVVTVGAQRFETKVIDNSVNPVWQQTFEAVVDEAEGQNIEIHLNDKDPNKDDKLGNVTIEIGNVFKQGVVDKWLQLEDIKSGMVHVCLTWLHLANDPLELDRDPVLQQVTEVKSKSGEDKLATAILMVNLDSARGLPRNKKTLVEPSPYVTLSTGQQTQESYVKANTSEPRWEQNFRFLLLNPRFQNLDVEVRDKKTGKTIGDASIRLKELLNAPDLTMDQNFQLAHSDPAAQIAMRLTLRVLTTRADPAWLRSESLVDEDEDESLAQGEGTSVDSTASGGTKSASPSTPPPQAPMDIPPADKVTPAAAKTEESAVRQRKAVPVAKPAGEFDLGRIQMTFRYSSQRQRLVVVVHKCVNLPPCDSDNLVDAYIRLYLLPERSSSNKRKTAVIKNNLNPVFDETFEFPVSPGELNNRNLEIAVKHDKSMFSSERTIVGIVMLDLCNLDASKPITEWFDLRPEDKVEKVSLVESDV